jgi:hypothetical protein
MTPCSCSVSRRCRRRQQTPRPGARQPAMTLRCLGHERIQWRGQPVDVVHMQLLGDYRGPSGLSVGSVCLELQPQEGEQ